MVKKLFFHYSPVLILCETIFHYNKAKHLRLTFKTIFLRDRNYPMQVKFSFIVKTSLNSPSELWRKLRYAPYLILRLLCANVEAEDNLEQLVVKLYVLLMKREQKYKNRKVTIYPAHDTK